MNTNRKQQILEVSLQLFYRRGISGVTMDDIAQALSISKKTLYKEFKSKDLLLMKLASIESNRFRRQANNLIFSESSSYVATCVKIIESFYVVSDTIMPLLFRDVKENYSEVYKIMLDVKDRVVNFQFRNFMNYSLDNGDIINSICLNDIVNAYEGVFNQFLNSNFEFVAEPGVTITRNPYSDEMASAVKILLRGICTDVETYDRVVINRNYRTSRQVMSPHSLSLAME